jgi:hypothetical protein
MENSAQRRGARSFPLAVAAACVTAVAALGGCHGTTTSTATATQSPTGTAQASTAQASPAPPSTAQSTPAGAGQAGACNPDYCAPADWDTARASTPLPQIPAFAEPLNVVISAKSTVSLTALQQALAKWKTVSTATTVSIVGIHLKCISSEMADVTGHGYVAQRVAWRLGGCLDGNTLSLTGDEDHVRIWNQPVPGSKYGAWFVAASYETMCLVRDGKLQTASANKVYAALHSGSAYHCVDGGPGSFHTAHPDGYDDGAQGFTAAIVTAAKSRGWHVSQRTVTVKRGTSSGEGGVPFDGTVSVLTVTA